jgi:predicted DNA-binding transcriptional regulator YafY
LGFGKGLEVLKPAGLRDRMKQILIGALENYEENESLLQ